MKVIRPTFVAAIILTFSLPSFAVVDQRLEVQGTNLVLSFPSKGYQSFLIQYRPSLDPADA